MSDRRLDQPQIRRAFGRAAATYDQHATLQGEIEARLFDSLDYYQGKPAEVLDVGCGTGRGARSLKKRWRDANVIALDLALPMLEYAHRHAGWRKAFTRVCADAAALPFPDRSVDVVYSSLCMPWIDAPKRFLAEQCRVLKPGGFMVASSLGPDTLKELREAWAAADSGVHVGQFADMHDLGDVALAAGFKDPVLDTDRLVLDYPDVHALLADLKGQGAANADRERARGLTGKTRFNAMLSAYESRRHDGRIPATIELVTMHAWGPPENFLPRYGGRETPFEVVQWAERTRRH